MKPGRKILLLLLTVVMVLELLPQSVIAEEMIQDSGSASNAGGVVTVLTMLKDAVRSQTVDIGTQWDELTLPDTLSVTAQVYGEGDTLEEAQEMELAGFTWQSEPEYYPLAEGEYIFTSVLPEGWIAQDGVTLPQITVIVRSAVMPMGMKLLSSIPGEYVFDVSEGNITIAPFGDGQLTVTYGAGETATFGVEQEITITGTSNNYSVVVTNGAVANITISDLTLNKPFQISSGAAVKLTLVGTNTMNGGLRVPAYASLTIMKESTGMLTAVGSGNTAAIGGGDFQAGGTITIDGGIVIVTVTGKGAGIGGGYQRTGGNITISGGEVIVTTGASNYGAGIGGGYGQQGGDITITNGKVNVTTGSNSDGAGIGGGLMGEGGTILITGGIVNSTTNGRGAAIGGGFGKGGNITIRGGIVNATTNSYGAGIGGGEQCTGVSILISGGTVNAAANSTGAGIGGGVQAAGGNITINSGEGGTIAISNSKVNVTTGTDSDGAGIGGGAFGVGGNITISGGEVDVTTADKSSGAGIGGGYQGTGGTINIESGTVTVTASTGSCGAGIGGGIDGNGGLIAISGGNVTVTTNSESFGAGIGGGLGGEGGNITISNGTVYATTDSSGAGIGGGNGRSGGTINISGDTVHATTNSSGAGIGGGLGGEGGTITIDGGTVYATANSSGAGIGGGGTGAGGNIAITGGDVIAATGPISYGACIGGGSDGAGGNIDISGGKVVTTTNSSNLGAGIGGGMNKDGGSITISGGEVEVTTAAYNKGAGIGGGKNGASGTITISGGFVAATNTAGSESIIGAGYNASDGTVTIQNAIVFKNAAGQAYGSAALQQNAIIPASKTLTISSGNSLTIEDGVVLTNNGSIYNSGTVGGTGDIQNNGLIVNAGVFGAAVTGNPVRTPLTDAMVQEISPKTYTGSAIIAPVIVMDGVTTLELDEGYEVTYHNNIGAGTASVTVTGIGLYIYEVEKSYTIQKANPAYTAPSGLKATYGQTLANVSLPGRFSWVSPSDTPVGNVGSNSFTVKYTPADTANYNTVTGIPVTVTVDKATPSFTTPTGLIAIYGQTLADVTLPVRFGWESPSGTPVGNIGSNSFTATYTPADTANYNTVKGIPVTITVGKATPTVMLTATSGILASDSATFAATVTGVAGERPDGNVTFKLGSGTLGTVMLANGTADYTWNNVLAGNHTITVEYGGSDNYNTATDTLAGYNVNKRAQTPLEISGVPHITTYGDEGFTLSVSGGSGNGDVTCAVTSGNTVQVDETTAAVTIVRAGQAVITAVKSGDDVYNPSAASVTIDVRKTVPAITIVPIASGIRSGSRLSLSALTGGAATGVGGAVLTGVFVWSDPSQIITSAGNYEVTLTPDNSANYAVATAMVPVSVTHNTSGSDSDGGSSSDGTTIIIQPEKKPDQPIITGFSVTPTVDNNGHATVTIPEEPVADAIAKALADAKTQGKTANGIGIVLNIDLPDTAKSLGIVLPQATLKSFVDAGIKQLEINGVIVSLDLDLEAFKEIRNQSTGDVTITLKPEHNLSEAAKKLIGTRPVYGITITYVKDGKTVTISSLNKGRAMLSIPYMPNKNEAVGYLYGVYVDGNDNVSRIAGSTYDVISRSIIFSTDHFSIYGVGYTAPSEKFTDIVAHWAKESIDCVVGRGLFSGTSDTTFSPDTAMSRGMLVTVLGRLAGVDVSAYKTSSFTDVVKEKYYLPYVEWAYKKGIVSGVGGNQFAPDRNVTREEIAVILANYAKATGYKLPIILEAVTFADSSGISSSAKDAVKAMQQAGIMAGILNNKFNPKVSAARVEVAVALHRYIKLTIDPATTQGGWSRNDDGQWMYYNRLKVKNSTDFIEKSVLFFLFKYRKA